MNSQEFRQHAHQVVDWIADYIEQIETYPVQSTLSPGAVKAQLPDAAPHEGEPFEHIFRDFQEVILPGMTHWQHPSFFAYFPASRSNPSILAEMLTAALGAQCMLWYTSPAAEELEARMMDWLQEMLGLPGQWAGAIHDTASTATLVALLMAREMHSRFQVNQQGLYDQPRFRVYASAQVHSSIDKDMRIAGLGMDNLVKIPVDETYAMIPEALEAAIEADKARGYHPLCVVAAMGTTSSTAIDPLALIGPISKRHGCFLHVDAAYAGTALLLPELRWMSQGLEYADSFVFNPHKWMFTHFDCSVLFVRDKTSLIRTFSILPEYLKTQVDQQVNNYRDWGIQLGRRFRALKLWFVIRSYGVEGLRKKIRQHIRWGKWLAQQVRRTPGFELMAPVPLNLVCFRYHPKGLEAPAALDALNESLLHALNASGQLLLTQTRLDGAYALRLVPGGVDTGFHHVQAAWDLIQEKAKTLQTAELQADSPS